MLWNTPRFRSDWVALPIVRFAASQAFREWESNKNCRCRLRKERICCSSTSQHQLRRKPKIPCPQIQLHDETSNPKINVNEYARPTQHDDPLHGLRSSQRRQRIRLRILWRNTAFQPRIVCQPSRWQHENLRPTPVAAIC